MAQQDPFEDNINYTQTCWLWTGTTQGGYGVAYWRGRMRRVHRLSWEWTTGIPIPDDLCIDHLCRVTNCLRFDHLEVVTWAENGRRAYRDSGVGGRLKAVPAPKPPAPLRDIPDGIELREYFERRKFECDGHWQIRSRQGDGKTPALKIEDRLISAHHLAFSWWVRPLKEDEVVLRTCEVRTCVFPGHLEAMSMVNFGRLNMGGLDKWRAGQAGAMAERAARAEAKRVEAERLERKALMVRQNAALLAPYRMSWHAIRSFDPGKADEEVAA
jgi:hypothetical protein